MGGSQISQSKPFGAEATGDLGLSQGANSTAFKLPNIKGLSQQPFGEGTDAQNNTSSNMGASATTHHLNVTVGQEKFMGSQNMDAGQRLPNLAPQGGSSVKLNTNVGSEYVGLMNKRKNARMGSMDYPGYIQQEGQPLDLAQGDHNLMTIQPESGQRSRGSKRSRTNTRAVTLLQPPSMQQ